MAQANTQSCAQAGNWTELSQHQKTMVKKTGFLKARQCF